MNTAKEFCKNNEAQLALNLEDHQMSLLYECMEAYHVVHKPTGSTLINALKNFLINK